MKIYFHGIRKRNPEYEYKNSKSKHPAFKIKNEEYKEVQWNKPGNF